MSFKKKIIVGVATGLVGMSLISGGTVAYFSSSVDAQNQIMSGTLELGIENEKTEDFYINVDNIKPGDTFEYKFILKNTGSIDIGKLSLISEYISTKKDGNPNDFGSQIEISKLVINDVNMPNHKLVGLSLHDIDYQKNDGQIIDLIPDFNDEDGVEVFVEFKFKKSMDKDQNEYQENKIDLKWTFEAIQELE